MDIDSEVLPFEHSPCEPVHPSEPPKTRDHPFGSPSLASSIETTCPTRAALDILVEGLRPFIHNAVRTSLGDDFFEDYLPQPGADVYALLHFLRNRWIAVFADTPLAPLSSTITRLENTAFLTRRRTFNPLPSATVAETIRDVQAVLIAIRKPALAARVSELGRIESELQDHLNLPIAQPVEQAREPCVYQTTESSSNSTDHAEQPTVSSNMPVALDGSNIAWRHGASQRFSIRGVVEALVYFAQRGHPSVVFLPEGRMRSPPQPGPGTAQEEIDAYAALSSLVGGPQLVLTPDTDYDDSYLINFARTHQAVVVSNDNFADQVYQTEAESMEAANNWRQWLSSCRLSYTFHGHAFVPNPSFSFERARQVALQLSNIVH